MKIVSKITSSSLVLAAAAFLPAVASAQQTSGFRNLLVQAHGILDQLIPLVIGLAVLVFLWGVLQYVVSKGADDKAMARSTMLYGILGLFVMVSVWGLVGLLSQTIFGNRAVNQPLPSPGIPVPNGARR